MGLSSAKRVPPAERKIADVRIGTSGWQYPHWKGPFYPRDLPSSRMLAEYCRRFDTVEINYSFYRLPSFEAFENWRDAAPPGFIFEVKGSRFITHMKKLKEPENALRNLLPRAARLREKLGPVLFQLPPGWRVNLERLETFLHALPRRHRYAFEFRDPSWHVSEVYGILRQHNAAFCIFDLAGFQSPEEITADFTYIRLHGPGGRYQGKYTAKALERWAAQIAEWSQSLAAVYVYFDNDQQGFAPANALDLRQRVQPKIKLTPAA